MKHLLLASCVLWSASACEVRHDVGSECPDGICPHAVGRAEPVCLVRQSNKFFEFPDPPASADLELPIRDADPDLGVHRLYWVFEEPLALSDGEPLRACTDAPFFEPPDWYDPELMQILDDPSPLVCLLKQASRTEEGGLAGEGWYFETTASRAGDDFRNLRFTAGIPRPAGVLLWLSRIGAQTRTRSDSWKETNPEICGLPEDSAEHASDVGKACLPSAVPERGFDESETVVEAGSRECATGVCLTHNLAGDPRDPCGETWDEPACQSAPADGSSQRPPQVEVDDRVYCSCRCDAPEGDPGELCTCKRGFSCVPTLLDAPPGVRGSYCIKDQTFNRPWRESL